MFNAKFNHPQLTWERPYHMSPKSNTSKTIINAVTADFKEKIKIVFLLEKYRQNMVDRFPLVDDVGIYIGVYCNQKIILPFAVKNVLDALSGPNLAYSDDNKVKSVYAKQVVSKNDVIKIALYPETLLHPKGIGNKAFMTFEVDAVPNEDIIQNPRTFNHKMMQNPNNTAYIGMITQEIKNKGVKLLYNHDLSVFIDICTNNVAGDIDNYCLPYLLAMEKLVYPDIRNVSHLHMNLHRNCAGKDFAEVHVNDGE